VSEFFHSIGLYFLAVLDHAFFWLGIGLAALELAKTKSAWLRGILGRENWPLWGLAGLCIFLATFQAWHEEHAKRKEGAVYLIADNPQFLTEASDVPIRVPVGKPLRFNVQWKTFGQFPALDVLHYSVCYIRDDSADSTQEQVVGDFGKRWNDEKEKNKPKSFGNLFPGDDRSYRTCEPESENPISEDTRNDLLYGRKIIFIVGAARFHDSAGEHESHTCRWLENNLSGNRDFGVISFHECSEYTTQVDISDP
jgi:hypothetical protein